MPTASSSPSTGGGGVAPIPVVVVPVPIPAPGPGSPQPAPGGSPTPGESPAPNVPGGPTTPTPTPPTSGSCSLPASHDSGCSRTSPSFLGDVEAAIDQLIRTEPSLFNTGRTQGCGTCYEVQNPTRYVQRVAAIVSQRGLCSVYDGEELAVKNTNSFSDQYDILTAQNFIRRDGGSYRATCRPAAF
ncbi:MAG TPA: hypothetical protein VFQ51_13885 [Vicinamibacteria bacterium]|nr:hypothetical protein [Vicinamibacteria bacterium]